MKNGWIAINRLIKQEYYIKIIIIININNINNKKYLFYFKNIF